MATLKSKTPKIEPWGTPPLLPLPQTEVKDQALTVVVVKDIPSSFRVPLLQVIGKRLEGLHIGPVVVGDFQSDSVFRSASSQVGCGPSYDISCFNGGETNQHLIFLSALRSKGDPLSTEITETSDGSLV